MFGVVATCHQRWKQAATTPHSLKLKKGVYEHKTIELTNGSVVLVLCMATEIVLFLFTHQSCGLLCHLFGCI